MSPRTSGAFGSVSAVGLVDGLMRQGTFPFQQWPPTKKDVVRLTADVVAIVVHALGLVQHGPKAVRWCREAQRSHLEQAETNWRAHSLQAFQGEAGMLSTLLREEFVDAKRELTLTYAALSQLVMEVGLGEGALRERLQGITRGLGHALDRWMDRRQQQPTQ